ncbi:MAG: phosphoglucosamine mutase [Actinomycetota bacterium]|nr:phosphoglucosamine mutase [Actinomycetota bacterium]
MTRLFGTDGVRGVANRDLTPDLALALGRAAGRVLAPGGGEVVIGRDTRVSGPMLEAALTAGLASAGVEVRLAGILPTPGVAFLTVDEKARAGAVISASHNPVADNGIKFFSELGAKLAESAEAEIEQMLGDAVTDRPAGVDVGGVGIIEGASVRYVDYLLGALDGDLENLKIVLDCAHGAAWEAGPIAFQKAGADVVAIHDTPDGSRINVECGSTSMGELAARVVDEGAALGLAFDGDADRVLAVDERGEAVDGDRIIGMLALELHDSGRLHNDIVVATVMSNLGFVRALEGQGIEVIAAPVGDKFVAEAMTESGAVLGGEQSGHVIFGEQATTGDGILTGLQVARAVAHTGRPLSELAHFFEPFPQVLINVGAAHKDRLEEATGLWADVRAAEDSLGDDGRVLVRASGTEPLVRVMVEAADAPTAQRVAGELADSVKRHLA